MSWSSAGPPRRRPTSGTAPSPPCGSGGATPRRSAPLTVGVDAGLAEGNGDVVVVMDLPDRETYAAYAADERHQAMIREHIRPILGRRCAVQHEL